MNKVIFILYRRADQTREQCLERWRGERHTSIIRTVPGLTRWVQNHPSSTSAGSACDAVGELWFDSHAALEHALNSPEMAAAVEDARNFLDMNKTEMLIVREDTIIGSREGSVTATSHLEQTLNGWAVGWATHDIERVASLCTEDCVYEDVPLGVVNHGTEELRAFGRQVFDAFPDFRIELTSRSATKTWALLEWVMYGTHEGDLAGIPATGASVAVRGATALELTNGRISRNSDYWDMATLLTQIGLMPSPASDTH